MSYGRFTSIALDPIEKKPLSMFRPGSMILSVGSYGCMLGCPFCQNHEIAQTDGEGLMIREMTPRQLADLALDLKSEGNIGVAYTYNEPLTFWEYIRDAGKLVHEAGMVNVLVSNGMAGRDVLDEILPYIDAMNIDLKAFREETYEKTLKGELDQVKEFIAAAAGHTHLELTTLIVPGMNDSDEEMEDMASWIASLSGGRDIPYHISRFFPRYRMSDFRPTDVDLIYHLADVAGRYLNHVFTGNC
jgi:pyruvate formate lyase activating enzyme